MQSPVKTILCGMGVWFVPFALGFLLFPVKESWPELFDAAMAVAVSLAAVIFGIIYLKRVSDKIVSSAVFAGIIWCLICIVIDVPIFTLAFGMNLIDYLGDIAVTYLIIPITMYGLGTIKALTK